MKQTNISLNDVVTNALDERNQSLRCNTEMANNTVFSMKIKQAMTPMSSKSKRRNLETIINGINTGEVSRAAAPNFIGMTPDLTKSPQIKLRSKLTETNLKANTRAKSILAEGSFRKPQGIVVDNKDQRRMNALEYRNVNLSDCMYHTMQSFKGSRKA